MEATDNTPVNLTITAPNTAPAPQPQAPTFPYAPSKFTPSPPPVLTAQQRKYKQLTNGLMLPRFDPAEHPAFDLLWTYATKGCPVDCGRDWTIPELTNAIRYGSHRSALILWPSTMKGDGHLKVFDVHDNFTDQKTTARHLHGMHSLSPHPQAPVRQMPSSGRNLQSQEPAAQFPHAQPSPYKTQPRGRRGL